MKKQIIENGNVYEIKGYVTSNGDVRCIIEKEKLEEMLDILVQYSDYISISDKISDLLEVEESRFTELYKENEKNLSEDMYDNVNELLYSLEIHVKLYNDEQWFYEGRDYDDEEDED